MGFTVSMNHIVDAGGNLTTKTQILCTCGMDEIIEYPDAYRYAMVHIVEDHDGEGGVDVKVGQKELESES